MAEVLFYHLTASRLEEALPGLVQRSLDRNWRVCVQFMSEERRDVFDNLLWTWSDASFTAHGTDREKWPEEQPVFLTVSSGNPNGAHVRFCVEGASCHDLSLYQRLVIMFDGLDNEQVVAARAQWKKLKDEGHEITYWQQTQNKSWERKA